MFFDDNLFILSFDVRIETLRKYPPLTFLMRKSTSSYTFAGTKVSIPKGQRIWIPAYAIQRDPDNYPEPDTFDPERFSEEVMQTRHTMTYIPFGDGPRNCIGTVEIDFKFYFLFRVTSAFITNGILFVL